LRFFKALLYTKVHLFVLKSVDAHRLYTWRQNQFSKFVQTPGITLPLAVLTIPRAQKKCANETELKTVASFIFF